MPGHEYALLVCTTAMARSEVGLQDPELPGY